MSRFKRAILLALAALSAIAACACGSSPTDAPDDAGAELMIQKTLEELFELARQDIAEPEDIGADYTAFWAADPEGPDQLNRFARGIAAQKRLFNRPGHKLTRTKYQIVYLSIDVAGDTAEVKADALFSYRDQFQEASEGYGGSAVRTLYEFSLYREDGAWLISNISFTDEDAQARSAPASGERRSARL